jgi:hypothetical protein
VAITARGVCAPMHLLLSTLFFVFRRKVSALAELFLRRMRRRAVLAPGRAGAKAIECHAQMYGRRLFTELFVKRLKF